MATKKPVKRIKLDSKNKNSTSSKTTKPAKKVVETKKTTKSRGVAIPKAAKVAVSPFTLFIGYVRGSWKELQMVRWPDRKASWSLTLAVILFTLFFAVLITLLDTAFQYIFKEVLLK